MSKRLIIIGGGAAGCMAAISAAGCDADVTLIEKNPAVAKKILSTGNGRCNYCHETVSCADFHRPDDNPFISAVMKSFPPEELIGYFRDLGITPVNKDGYIYPYSEQAKAVNEVLKRSLSKAGVNVITDTEVTDITRDGDEFRIICADKTLTADRVILTTGGKAAPVTGSDGMGLDICKKLGHRIISPVPALTFLNVKDHAFKKAAGVRLSGRVSAEIDGTIAGSDTGQIQVTKTGFSGIPVFNISRYASRALSEKTNVMLHLRLVPDMDENELYADILKRTSADHITAYEALIGLLPDSFADCLIRYAGLDPDARIRDAEQAAKKICRCAEDIIVTVDGTGEFKDAQVSCGGVDLNETNPASMESKKVPGLYLAGEILDADGKCGGYNLYFAFATGLIAGRAAASN